MYIVHSCGTYSDFVEQTTELCHVRLVTLINTWFLTQFSLPYMTDRTDSTPRRV